LPQLCVVLVVIVVIVIVVVVVVVVALRNARRNFNFSSAIVREPHERRPFGEPACHNDTR